ncbi:MAG TPA: RNA polymerase sigma factor [Blastocatellia bacterium]|nr:RNA polymerase sigma factor [Blastocatellia bacterium]
MLKLWKSEYSHEDLFIQRYEWLRRWSLQLTGHNLQHAEDLVHDAFIQFTLACPDLDKIQNLEGYLYCMLRNMHLSQVRRAARNQNRTVSIVNYDSAEISLRAVDPRTLIQARDELRMICDYACSRKETSKAGSVLILRFFHGYYPGEIAKVMRSQRRAVDDWLRIARKEAKDYLQNPRRLSLLKNKFAMGTVGGDPSEPAGFLEKLRHSIFRSRQRACLPVEQLLERFGASEPATIDCALLAHIVSCPDCLDEINKLLGLPPLSERYPTDMIGPDARSGRGTNKSGIKGASKDSGIFLRKVREVFEHSPKELLVSVNGFIIGSQSIGSELSEQTISIGSEEKIGFIEIFSEQQIRLIYLGVEPPPDGPVDQSARVELSEGRTLDLRLSFSDTRPDLTVVYYDPLLKPVSFPLLQDAVERYEAETNEEAREKAVVEVAPPRFALEPRISFASLRWWLRPGPLTAALAMLLAVLFLLAPLRSPSVSAAELLRQSADLYEASVAGTDLVIHKVINFEERRQSDGALLARRRIDIWSNPSKGISARRVYDYKNEMIAAEWIETDGSRLVYNREAGPGIQRLSERHTDRLLEAMSAWQLDLSAKDFSSLIQHVDAAEVKESGEAYIISYQGEPETSASKLVKATITIGKSDFRPIEQVLLVSRRDEIIQYRFAEQRLERVPSGSVAPSVFRIDSYLLGSDSNRIGIKPPALESETVEPAAAQPIAFSELKVSSSYELHRVGACLVEQPDLSRTAEGELRIQAIVENERRKGELMRALNSIANSPAVKVEISTLAEAVSRHVQRPQAPVRRRVEIIKDQIPVYDELKRHFSGQGEQNLSADVRVDGKIRQFANRTLTGSREALLQAWALKHHAAEVSEGELSSLDPQTREKWRQMLREHLLSYERETRGLRLELQSVFFESSASGLADDTGAESGSDLRGDIERLFKLASAHEKAVRRAFTVSNESPEDLIVKKEQFLNSLKSAERLARHLIDSR